MIYLDNAATTRPFESVIRKMDEFYKELYYNPSALYKQAAEVESVIEKTRDDISDALGGGGRVYFTSCATESNAWVYASGVKNKKGNVVVSAGEHASGFENAQALISRGTEVRFVNLTRDGTVDIKDFENKVDENTSLVSVIHCSNETGAINDIGALSRIVKRKSRQALFHSDGVQAFGKIAVNCKSCGIDLYSISAHKIGGPKGIGGLWVRDGLHPAPFLRGGGQENGYRSGTENTAGIIGFGEALKCFSSIDANKISAIRKLFYDRITLHDTISVRESAVQSPYILSFAVHGTKAEQLQRMLSEHDILIGLGSACASRSRKNRVLSAMGLPPTQIEGSVRLSFGAENLTDDIGYAIETLLKCVDSLQTGKISNQRKS